MSWPRAPAYRRANLRGVARRVIAALLGQRAELAAHAAYHAILRTSGRFLPPEDSATLAVLAALAGRSRTCIDIGAGVGRYTHFLRARAPPDATVYAFEPNPYAATLLRSNLRRRANVQCLALAVGATDGEARLSVPRDPVGNPVTALGWIASGADGGDGIAVGIRRLDGLVESGALQAIPPILMKIDVEGREADVLRGALRVIESQRPVIYLECEAGHARRAGSSTEVVWRQLGDLGYAILAAEAGRFRFCSGAIEGQSNYFALPDIPGHARQESLSVAGLLALLSPSLPRRELPPVRVP